MFYLLPFLLHENLKEAILFCIFQIHQKCMKFLQIE